MIKIDLHTHSIASYDGGLRPQDYEALLENNTLDYIAITDHNTIELAEKLHVSLGKHIIVGEEIMTSQGELIGLFLKKTINPGMTALATARAITDQGGLVYVPHPFETVRHGIQKDVLDLLVDEVDIVEVHNGRAMLQKNRGPEAYAWSRMTNKAAAASSDAHGPAGMASSYTMIAKPPSAKNLVAQLREAHFATNRPPLRSLLYPKYHRIVKKIRRS